MMVMMTMMNRHLFPFLLPQFSDLGCYYQQNDDNYNDDIDLRMSQPSSVVSTVG